METEIQKKKILIIEDEVPMMKALTAAFTREHFQVIEAREGGTGLSIALNQHPDVILLDILLPKIDGLTILKKLRTEDSEFGRTVPVIFLTNLSANNDAINKSITEHSPAYYLVKTEWTTDDIVEKVKERLGMA